jgi:aldehyde:ferredoxin oxidoreductase
MSKLGGYSGSILKVDLSSGEISSTPLSRDLVVRFIGGSGLNARLAYDQIEADTPALSPRISMILGAGPLVGTLTPLASRTNITSKSPLSGYIGSSGAGHMGALKYCGYDHLIITGKADAPVILEIGDDVRISPADHLWGKDTWETTEAIRDQLGRQRTIATIGPAGENQVRTSSILIDKKAAFGKTGLGAVMGSKNLKAIVLSGTKGVTVADPKRFMKLVNNVTRQITGTPGLESFQKLGIMTIYQDMLTAKNKTLPYKNGQQILDPENTPNLHMKELWELVSQSGNISCLSCPIGCKNSITIPEGPYAGLGMIMGCFGPSTGGFGGLCGLAGWDEIVKCSELCNRLGMDYSSAGLISMAIELYQNGIIDRSDTDGMELDWHQPKMVHDLLYMIAHREGFGDILAEGSLEAQKRIGAVADGYSVQYKGQIDTAGADPRPGFASWTRSLITSPIGQALPLNEIHHLSPDKIEGTLRYQGIPETDIKRVLPTMDSFNSGELTRCSENYVFALECLGLCAFWSQMFGMDTWAEVYSAATGIEMDGPGLLQAAARGIDMRRAFNIREGAGRKDDTIPKRFMTESVSVHGETRLPFESEALDAEVAGYYMARDWDMPEGTVSSERLAELLK